MMAMSQNSRVWVQILGHIYDAMSMYYILKIEILCCIFTTLHGMQTQSSDENSVCLSVRPSVRLSVRLSHACIVTKRKKNLSRFLHHTKDNLA